MKIFLYTNQKVQLKGRVASILLFCEGGQGHCGYSLNYKNFMITPKYGPHKKLSYSEILFAYRNKIIFFVWSTFPDGDRSLG
jgi:hypothetical protein